ncbi:TlpA family protein disulfide reductase [Maribacter sp. X9]|uniref:TlpA family protein disulfide reductase n=1 Tax=Maribacter sp. X9 TaxID=3402159 RepID=UPI003AF3C74B
MKNWKFKISDILFVVFIALLIIPQTRTPIQVALNKLKVAVWSPSVENSRDQQSLMPFKYQLYDLNSESVIIPVGEGNITFLSYWATWCPPCLAEMPGIQELYTDYGDKVEFILLTQEDPKVVQRFLDKKGYNLPVYFPQNTPEILSSKSIPTNYIIDGHGTILIKETGAADWNSKKVRTLLDGLVAQ